ncbi:hypothetical protein CAEBREN_25007 [Caenorhabditis brenneri]|uniref:T20D4.11-like domain-containing protein n=1 Tax=Caenorhabditis brenneri TaxID=135651 RepID=G0MT65_CAEBE|nr:hypothetical protein CAEBREN_25007 [Caenorhabditis brenneri]
MGIVFKNFIFLLLLSHFVPSASSNSSTNGDVAPCLSAVYDAVYTGTYNCTHVFDSIWDNSTSQRSLYTSGKSCLLEVAKKECTGAQYNLLSTKYEDFLDVLTTEPKDPADCSNFYYKYNRLKCEPIIEEAHRKMIPLVSMNVKTNDSRLLEAIGLCEKVQSCISPPCLASASEKVLVDRMCESLKMKKSELFVCFGKIQKQVPDVSEYKCLDGMDFYDTSPKIAIEKLTTKKGCLKEILEDICGENAVANFEEDTKFMLNSIKQRMEMADVFSN